MSKVLSLVSLLIPLGNRDSPGYLPSFVAIRASLSPFPVPSGKPINEVSVLSVYPLIDGLVANNRTFEFDPEASGNNLGAPSLFEFCLDITGYVIYFCNSDIYNRA